MKTNIFKNLKTFAKIRRGYLAAVVLLGVTASVAFALTPSFGLTSTLFVRASFADKTDIKFKVKGQGEEVIHVPNAQETVLQRNVFIPGGYTGWHTHPGPVLILVKSGRATFYAGDDPTCTPRVYSAGESFIDSGQGHIHMVRNESATDNLEVYSIYFDVTPGGATRIDTPAPGNCSF